MTDSAVDFLVGLFDQLQQQLFEQAVQPLLFALGGAALLEDAFNATGWLLVGLLQITAMMLFFAPLERWRPAQRLLDRHAVRVDVLYTLIHRMGLFRLVVFFLLEPLGGALQGQAALYGLRGWQLDAWFAAWWPGVTDTALAAFLLYLVLFDLFDYWFHRLEHRYDWWWALHAVHHSQRHMTMWTDNRNHLLDDLLHDVALALLARLIGVAPGQFVAVVACTQLVENFAHLNVNLSFGWLGDRLLVSPRFHRIHHAVGLGHESQGKGTLGGHNFAVLFPIWDVVFRTARFDHDSGPIGIRDQMPGEGERDYGRGFWAQQRLGLLRMIGRA
jgi:sterol desaturase/sphingolipid hydroxylase (fatty acid hydroxylase superfamily)